jgi:hypothetical protein
VKFFTNKGREMKTEAFFVLGYKEFDKLVNDNIPSADGKYNFAAGEEASNDSSHIYRVINDVMLDYDLENIEGGELQYNAGVILNYLCRETIIPAGNYLIEVSW